MIQQVAISQKNLGMELVRVTEAAALACARLLGKGDPDRVSEVAGEAMRRVLEESGLSGSVVLGPRDEHNLAYGSTLAGGDRIVDFGLFPVEGASQVARGSANAVSIIAAVEPGGFANLPPIWYVEKMVAGPGARGAIDLDDSIADNLRRIAFARDARVLILDEPTATLSDSDIERILGVLKSLRVQGRSIMVLRSPRA